MIRSPFRTSIAALVLVWLPAPAGVAQTVTGTIAGTVVDEQGHVVPGATVTVVNDGTREPRVVVTDARGDFQVVNLQPGTYTLRLEMQGFRTVERKGIVLTAAERLSIGTLTLAVGAVGETVVVEAAGTHVNVAESQHSGLITSTQSENIQGKGRDVTSLLRLMPGVR